MMIQRSSRATQRGVMMIDLVIALGLLAVAMVPLALGYARETRLIQGEYVRAVAMEIVDGEAEVLAAGEGKNYAEGTHDYPVRLKAAATLPDGRFTLTRTGDHLRLEWHAAEVTGIGPVVREMNLR